MATTKIPVELSSTPGIVDNSNATAITIDSSENVGIGETAPDTFLHVKGTGGGGQGTVKLEGQSAHLGFTRADGNFRSWIGQYNSTTHGSDTDLNIKTGYVGGSSSTGNIRISADGDTTAAQLYVQGSTGNVGIGTATPAFTNGGGLEIERATSATLRIQRAGADAAELFMDSTGFNIKDLSVGKIIFGTTNAERMRLTDVGLGIGTTSPNQWASYTDSAATVLQVRDTSERARVVINGGNGAHLDLVDYAGSTNDKHMNIAVDGGVLKFGSLNDAGNAFVQNNILIMDLGTGAIKFNNAYTFPTSDGSASQFLQTDGSGNLSFATVSASDNTKLPLAGGTLTGNLSSSAQIMTTQESANALKTRFLMGKDSGNTNNGALYINYATSHDVLIGAGGGSSDLVVSGGKLGIGVSSPSTMLHMNGTGDAIRVESTNSGAGGAQIDLLHFSPSPADNDVHGVINFGGYYSGTTSAYGSAIKSVWSDVSAKEAELQFFTRDDSDFANRMTIDKDGHVGIGTTSPATKVQLGDYGDASEVITFATSQNGTARLNFYDNNNTEGSYIKSVGEAYGGAITMGARWDDDEDKVVFKLLQNSASSSSRDCRVGLGTTSPNAVLSIVENKNYDPPGLGNATCHFSMLKKDSNAGGDYGIVHGVASDGHVWSQVQRVDGSATAYNQYLQPDGGSVAIGLQNNYTYLPNLTHRLHVATKRSGTGNVSSYLAKMSIEAIGYAGSNYQLGAIDFGGGDTAGAHNYYGRIGCSSMNGANNQESGSLEFYVKAPSFSLDGTAHAMKICGKVDTGSAGGGTSRNGVLFTYQGIAIDRTWSNYPGISVLNATPYSSTASTQSELRIHGTNMSSASYPSTSGSDFSVVTRSDGGYATGSDRRRKKNITTIDNALSTVKQLTGKRFQTVNSADEVQEHVSKNGYKFGFIAQEVEDIIPETVQYHADEDDGTDNYNTAYAMDYGSVVALLVNAIKEQDTTIEALEARIKALEDK